MGTAQDQVSGRRKFIIDCDAGSDDAIAILIALSNSDKIEVVAITTVYGNTSLSNTTRNVLRVLNMCKRLDIPVYAGCSVPLIGTAPVMTGYHGFDGLGDCADLYPPDNTPLQKEHASNALIRLASQHHGEITLVALGPLTNVAVALRLDPDLGHKLQACYIMGGSISSRCNYTPTAEFNFHSDPVAAHTTLNDLGGAVTIVPLDVCEQLSFSWEWHAKFVQTPTPRGKFVQNTEKVVVASNKAAGQPLYFTCDPLVMVVAIDSQVVMETEKVYALVECGANHCQGQLVVDWNRQLQKEANVTIVTKANRDLLEKYLHMSISA